MNKRTWDEKLRVVLRDLDEAVFSDEDLAKAKVAALAEWGCDSRYDYIKPTILLWGAIKHAVEQALAVEGKIPGPKLDAYHQLRFNSHVQWERRLQVPQSSAA